MQRAALLYNPDSGRSGQKRLKALESALAVLRGAGVTAELIPTETRDEAGQQAQRAIDSGCDTIFACGGDGTIHNIVQVLAHSTAALGILPMGTANALAHDLGIPNDLERAAKAAVRGVPRRVAVGHVRFVDLRGNPGSRFFTITAGMGVDAHLFYKLLTATKRRMGMVAYYAKAWNLWFSYPMTRFSAEYLETDSDEPGRAEVTELMCVRIQNFGGVVKELAPGASLDRNDMRAVVCRTSARLAYLAYVTRGLLRRRWQIPGIELVHCTKVACGYLEGSSRRDGTKRIYVEADGELVGTLPAEMTVVPDALTILAPKREGQ
ncbi:MAG TPA: YegS/Rv2252/BmrU family lipid kinase [Candidatus Sulfotelmatobacter sp.]|nr:YegS/Rv2252/BmrU family lipid kinase [Candidatus Sulfotelmatobacter sp.]